MAHYRPVSLVMRLSLLLFAFLPAASSDNQKGSCCIFKGNVEIVFRKQRGQRTNWRSSENGYSTTRSAGSCRRRNNRFDGHRAGALFPIPRKTSLIRTETIFRSPPPTKTTKTRKRAFWRRRKPSIKTRIVQKKQKFISFFSAGILIPYPRSLLFQGVSHGWR